MLIFLPFLFVLLLVAFIKKRCAAFLWREALLISFLCFGCLVFVSTEILSLFKLFYIQPIGLFWALNISILLCLHFIELKKNPRYNLLSLGALSVTEMFILKLIVVLAIMLGLLAFYMPPNTWDAMTYHMARVAHWIQNGTVGPYPTNIERQLTINPFAEYWLAQFQILSGGRDYFANSVQWLSMLGSLVGISLIARELGMGRLGQILSAFFVITLPNAIIQSTSTQTDFVATLWCVIAVYFMLKNIHQWQWKNTLAIAAAGGLAFYTKGSVFFIIGPFLGWMIFSGMAHQSARRQTLGHIGLILSVLLVFLGLFFLKNYIAIAGPILPGEKAILMNLSVQGVASDELLHWAMHLKLGVPEIDKFLNQAVEGLHHMMGFTVSTSPANFSNYPFNDEDSPFFEDLIPNFLFSIFYLFFWVDFILFKRARFGSIRGKFHLISFFCFFLFSGLVRWAPFDGRYQLPFFVLFALLLADTFCEKRKFLVSAVILFFVSSIPFILFNCSKPIISKSSIINTPRDMRYFYNQPDLLGPVRMATQDILISGCQKVGLDMGEDSWEYPFWVYLHQSDRPIRIEHVLVHNPSGTIPYPLGDFLPCVIVSRQNLPVLNAGGHHYWADKDLGVFSLYHLSQ